MRQNTDPYQTNSACFGRYVHGLRLRYRMSLDEVGERVGRTASSISQLERGVPGEVPVSLILRYATAFNLNFERLCFRAVESLRAPSEKPSRVRPQRMMRSRRAKSPRRRRGRKHGGTI